jgi:hypothetical protein
MRSSWRRLLPKVMLAVTVSMSTGEFIELQKLTLEELRARFKLPPTCDPAVTALNTDPSANHMMVAIECRVRPAPANPGHEPRPANKGS